VTAGRRSARRGALVSLASLAVAVGGVEIALRLGGYDPLAALSGGRADVLRPSDDPDLSYELTPGASAFFRGCHVDVNSLGFRGPELARTKPAGVRRAVVLGDSVAFGDGLELEDTFPVRLQELLRADGLRAEVANLGVGGYDVLDEVVSFERLGRDLEPDAVVLAFCTNDAGVQSFNLPFVEAMKRMGPLVRRSRLLQFLTVRVDGAEEARRYASLNREDVFRERNARYLVPLGDDADQRERMRRIREACEAAEAAQVRLPFVPWYASETRLAKIRYAFERLARATDPAGVPVLVLMIPYLEEKGRPEAFALVYEAVRHEAERVGFAFVCPREAFAAAGFAELARYPDRMDPLHPNPEGHRLLAETLRAALPPLWPVR